jgi:hypothetical protein
LEEGREGDDAGVLFGPFLERISFVDREREGDDIGAPFTPSAHISSSSFLVYGPHEITKPFSSTIFGISPPGLRHTMKSIGSEGRILDA